MNAVPPKIRDLENTVVTGLIRLIELCEGAGMDFDLMVSEARRIHSGEPYFGT